MSGFDQLPEGADTVFGEGATAQQAYDLLTVDVPAASWTAALETARTVLGCTFFDWLSAVDEPGTGFRVCAHVVRLTGGVRRLLIRTTVPYEAAALPTATGIYPGASWHERETYEMFGVDFTGHPGLVPLLLPEEFEGHPLRKDFVLAARVAKAWPGAKEPGESHDGGPKRRQMQPPGVPDPNEWGPLKGQLPPAPARPARTPRAAGAGAAGAAGRAGAGAAGAAGERPARRTRSVTDGSASQAAGTEAGTEAAPGASAPSREPRRRAPDAPWEKPRETPPAREADEPSGGRRSEPGDAPAPERPTPAQPARTPEAPGTRAPKGPTAPESPAVREESAVPEPQAPEPSGAQAPEESATSEPSAGAGSPAVREESAVPEPAEVPEESEAPEPQVRPESSGGGEAGSGTSNDEEPLEGGDDK